MKYIEELYTLPFLNLLDEYTRLIQKGNIWWNKNRPNQICVNTIVDRPNDIFAGHGSLTHDWNNSYRDEEGNIQVPKRDVPLKESDFSIIATPFKGTLFEDAFNILREKYNIGRLRIMNSKPKTCLSWHVDYTDRIHFPMKTQIGCFMVIRDKVEHLHEGKWYYVNTQVYHTAVNSSMENRLHLVAEVITG